MKLNGLGGKGYVENCIEEFKAVEDVCGEHPDQSLLTSTPLQSSTPLATSFELKKITTLFQQLVVTPEASPRKRNQELSGLFLASLKAMIEAIYEGRPLTLSLIVSVTGEVYLPKKHLTDADLVGVLLESVVRRLKKGQKLKSDSWDVDLLPFVGEVKALFEGCSRLELLQFAWLWKHYGQSLSVNMLVPNQSDWNLLERAKETCFKLLEAALSQKRKDISLEEKAVAPATLEELIADPSKLKALLHFCSHSKRIPREVELLKVVLQLETLLKNGGLITGAIEKCFENMKNILQKPNEINFDQKTKAEWLKALPTGSVIEPVRWFNFRKITAVKPLKTKQPTDERVEQAIKVCGQIKGAIFLMIQQNYFGYSLDHFTKSLEYLEMLL
jgi:hypothetical protein